jgi:hypothetical protein
MATSRITANRITSTVLVAFSSAVLLVGCSGSDGEALGPTPTVTAASTPTASETSTAAVSWADGVCSASSALQKSVQDVGDALQINLSGSKSARDQARAQVADKVAAVKQAATALGTALTTTPTGATPELTAAQQELKAASDQAQTAVDQLDAAAGQITDASTPKQLATALSTLKTALTKAGNDLSGYLTALGGDVTAGQGPIRDAFSTAPACKELAAQPTQTTQPTPAVSPST